MDEHTPPPIHPSDEHPEVPFSSSELDIADSDRKVMESREQEEAARLITTEPETPEEHAERLAQLKMLTDRYDPNKKDSEAT